MGGRMRGSNFAFCNFEASLRVFWNKLFCCGVEDPTTQMRHSDIEIGNAERLTSSRSLHRWDAIRELDFLLFLALLCFEPLTLHPCANLLKSSLFLGTEILQGREIDR